MEVIPNEVVPQGSSEWMSFREGKITGTKLGKIYAKSRKAGEIFDTTKRNLGYYELLAEKLAEGTGDDDGLSSSRERGHDLEAQAIDSAEEITGKVFTRGGVWELDDTHIESPDGYTEDLEYAVEAKCLSSARHIQAIMENQPPKEYWAEYLNYFLVNDKLKVLYVVLYDPRFMFGSLQTKVFEIKREDIEDDLERMRAVKKELCIQLEQDISWLTRG